MGQTVSGSEMFQLCFEMSKLYKLKWVTLQFQVGEEAKGWLESRMACSSLSEYAKLATIGSLEVVFCI